MGKESKGEAGVNDVQYHPSEDLGLIRLFLHDLGCPGPSPALGGDSNSVPHTPHPAPKQSPNSALKNQAWWHTLVIPVLGRLRQEDCRFTASLSNLRGLLKLSEALFQNKE